MAITATTIGAVMDLAAAAFPGAVVSVVSGGQTARGIGDTEVDQSEFSNIGQTGSKTRKVFVESADMTPPLRNATIKVNGNDVIVLNVSIEPITALMEISYQVVRPVEGV